jgi:hypothetical protein
MIAFLLFVAGLPAFAESVVTLRWNELQGAVGQREATVITTDNRQVKGVVTSVTEDGVLLASGRVERRMVREIRVRQVKGPRRAIFAAGAGAGTALALLPWAISDSRVNVSDSARITQWGAITAGAAVAGYFVGRHLDKKETVIRIAQ